jgi:Ca-activated chloride channel family protein
MRALIALPLVAAAPAQACSIALVLAMDVSGSVDAFEYQLQATGVAAALRDPEVRGALIDGQVAVAVLQWSGLGEQTVTLPWVRVAGPADADRLSARVAAMPRAHGGGNTAVGEAIAAAARLFDQVPDCAHWVIDISGDGDENEGFRVGAERRSAWSRGIHINGLAIEDAGASQSITSFYRRHVITPGGFVITARQHDDFFRAMREKLLRELVPPMAQAPGRAWLAFLHPQSGERLFFDPETPMVTGQP